MAPYGQLDVNTTDLYRCGPVLRWRCGAHQDLLRFPLVGINRIVSTAISKILVEWTTFQPIQEVASAAVAENMPESLGEFHRLVNDLKNVGALVSRSRLASPRAPERAFPSNRISCVAIPTAARGTQLDRAVRSYVDNMARFEHQCPLLICDDSRDACAQAETVKLLQAIGTDLGCPIWYAGIDEKLRYARRLAGDSGCDPALAEFALLGTASARIRTGANRNAILLHTHGSCILSADDDTICVPRAVVGSGSNLMLSGHMNAAEAWCFPDASSATSWTAPKPLDVLAEHEQYLGQPLSNALCHAGYPGPHVDLDHMCAHMLSSLNVGQGTIRTSYSGARGDSGFHSDLSLILHDSAATRRRLRDLGPAYRRTVESRQIVRQAIRPTISHVDTFTVGMCMGLYNRGIVPPYMPIGRNQDGLFGHLLARLSDHDYTVSLPFTIGHHPLDPRAYTADRDVTIRVNDCLIGYLSTCQVAQAGDSRAERLVSFGKTLCQIAALPPEDFDELSRVLILSRVSSIMLRLEYVLAGDADGDSEWRSDLEGRILALRQLAAEPERCLPVDVPQYDDLPPRRCMQSVIQQFGQLLQAWEVLLESAAKLRECGITPARRLCN
jgi:hypothetical protein